MGTIMKQDNLVALGWPIKRKWRLKPAHIKYGGAVLVFFMMIAAIRVFLNYANIQASIEHVIEERDNIIKDEQYESIRAYMYSQPISRTFIAHDNGVLFPWEKVVVKIPAEKTAEIFPQATWDQLTGDLLTGSDLNVLTGSLSTGEQYENWLYSLPSWRSWVLYFGQKIQ